MAPLRIAYISHWDPFHEDGVVKKIRWQVEAWRHDGAEVETFILSQRGPGEAGRHPVLAGSVFLYGNPFLGRFRETLRLQRAVRDWNPDVVYIRYTAFLPPPLGLLRRIPSVVEVNSDDRAEYRGKHRSQRTFNSTSRLIVLRLARGMVCVTPQLARRMSTAYPSARVTTITNGIDLQTAHRTPPAAHTRPRLAFIASAPYPWHGLDKILSLAVELPKFDFDLVGPLGIRDTGVPPNVKIRGPLDTAGCQRILAGADVALAGLAFHRIGLSEACPLKVREYLGQGLPVIVGYHDPDLGDAPWFALELPNREDNVATSRQRIEAFVREAAGKRVPLDDLVGRIGIQGKEKHRLAFLNQVVGSKTGGHGRVASHRTTGITTNGGPETVE